MSRATSLPPPETPLVIPIVPGSKRPLFKGWQQNAKPMSEWLASLPDWPSWAMPQGPTNMRWTLDVDPQHGGFESLEILAAGRLVLTNRTDTPSGGFHTAFLWEPQCQNLRNSVSIFPGLDVRADGAYVLCPPTAGYVTRFETRLEPAPSWLLEALMPKHVPLAPGNPIELRHSKAYADAAVSNALGQIRDAQPGTRNHTLNRNAYGIGKLLVTCNLDFDKVLEVLVDEAIANGMPAYEALDTTARALRDGAPMWELSMNRTLILAVLLALTGCGFGLTKDAIHCGTHQPSGMDVWVDGQTVEYSTVTVPAMTCDQAMLTIDQALTIGDYNGFWEKTDETSYGFLGGIRLEFVNQQFLKQEGFAGSDGITVDYLGTKEMDVSYAYDVQANYNMVFSPNTDASKTATWASAVILVHEMTHALQDSGFMNLGDLKTSSDGHCNWSKSYAPKYANLGAQQYNSNFIDSCQHKQCSGSFCTPEKN